MKIKDVKYPQEMSWYIRPFTNYNFADRSLEIGLFVPIKFYAKYLWYKVPDYILSRQQSECLHYIPDFYSPVHGYAQGDKVKPLFGYILMVSEGAIIKWNWWSQMVPYIKR